MSIKKFEEFISESIDSRVRSKITVLLKSEGIIFGEDYDYVNSLFMAKDIETAREMADALVGEYRVMIYDDKVDNEGKVPMMIAQ